MSYEENINISGFDNGLREFPVNNLQPIQFSQIFNGVPQLFPGSSFTVEEVMEFGCLVDDASIIDVDFRWYPAKRYLGTWTVFDQVSSFGTDSENRGFIEDTIQKIKRYSTYVIQANANVPSALHEVLVVDNCNFSLKTVTVAAPGFLVGQSIPSQSSSLFSAELSLSKVPLIDKPFNAKIKTIGLYVSPGAILTFINYKCRVINAISVDLPAFPVTNCNLYPEVSCASLYATFLANPPSGLLRFSTQAQGIAYANSNNYIAYTLEQITYTCPIAPGTTYTYWLFTPPLN